MMLFASWTKHPFNVPVQCPHDADARQHGMAAPRRDQDQGFHRGRSISLNHPGSSSHSSISVGAIARFGR
jgi:hypothetical protein